MMNEKDLGIYVKKEKKFFYLETGNIFLNSHIIRIKKILIQRNLIIMTDASYTDSDQYDVLSIEDAQEKEYEFHTIFLNSHIRKHYEEENKTNTSKW